ncbi:MAG: protein kinase [Anaerolineae bacterium]|nr:protein kinase [Anaerolineae bacterium]
MRIKFWGVRGSIPATLNSNEVKHKLITALMGAQNVDLSNRLGVQKYVDDLPLLIKGTVGSNTPCVSIEAGSDLIILDAGSGIRTCGIELMKGEFGRGQGTVHIFISHTHWDHIQGFPFFTPAYVRGNRVLIYSPFPDLQERLRKQQEPEFFPRRLDQIPADVQFVQLEEGVPVTVGGVRVNNILQTHPGRSYGYRLEGDGAIVVYATDSEYKDLGEAHTKRYVEFMSGADLLIFDAQYTLSDSFQLIDWGHSSSVIGIDMATRANVKRIALFHFDHTYTDQQIGDILETTLKYIKSDPTHPNCEVYLATESLQFDIGRSQKIRLECHQVGDSMVLSIEGRFDARASEQVDLRLTELISDQHGGGLVVDLSKISHLSIAGLKTLLNAQQMGQGIPLLLAAAPQNVQEVLSRVGFSEAFEQYDSVAKAVAALEAKQYLQLEGHVLHDRYRIESSINMGTKHAIFKAFDTWFERPVTVKVLSKSLGDDVNQRLLGEAKAVARLNHLNIAAVYDCVEYQNQLYLIREFVDGQTLEHWLGKDSGAWPFSPSDILHIAQDVLSGLDYAHRRHVLHQTLRPASIILSDRGAKIINFGLMLSQEWSFDDVKYVSPEQLAGENATERSDLFSLGVILYLMLTGQLPFDGNSVEAVLQVRSHTDPIPLHQIAPSVPLPLERIVLTLLSRDPLQRYPSAAMTLDALADVEPWKA